MAQAAFLSAAFTRKHSSKQSPTPPLRRRIRISTDGGFKVDSFFTPYDVNYLDGADSDFGSGAPLLLPDSAGIPGHQHLIVAVGKAGQVYVLDRDNLSGWHWNYDDAVDSTNDGSGHFTPPQTIAGVLSTPAYANGKLYIVSAYNGRANAYTINNNGTLSVTSSTTDTFGYAPGSVFVSSNGTAGGITWVSDRAANEVHAYDAAAFSTQLWNSGQAVGGTDLVGAVNKFVPPIVANGQLYLAIQNGLAVYGLKPAAAAVPYAPILSAQSLSGTSIDLTWTDATPAPNTATSYTIEDSTDGTTFSTVTTVPTDSTTVSIGGLMPQTAYSFRIEGRNAIGASSASNAVHVTTTSLRPTIDFGGGFASVGSLLQLNGSAVVAGQSLSLTDGQMNAASSVFSSVAVDVTRFATQFAFQIASGAETANGFTFAIQKSGPTALGASGEALGFGNGGSGVNAFPQSLAIKFDLYDGGYTLGSSTGLFLDGADPAGQEAISTTPWGINLHSGDIYQTAVNYDGTILSFALTDTQTAAVLQLSYPIDIPGLLGSNTAYVGFTASTETRTATQNILNWQFVSLATISPDAPTGLGAAVTSATSIALNWSVSSTNQSGFHLDRATDAAFSTNLITETIAQNANTFTDTAPGLAPGATYYYRLRAFNATGESGNSNSSAASIPLAPPRATHQTITDVTSTEIDLQWQDNAGHKADGYKIFRATALGALVQVATLPPTSRTAPSSYTWSDTGLTPGVYYEYHIVAYNVSGNNDFAGINSTTLSQAPASLAASAGAQDVILTWSASVGALSYSVYRGLVAGAETLLISGLTVPGYTDVSTVSGFTYFYRVTATNANPAPLPAESAPSVEVSTNPAAYNWPATGSGTYAWNTAANWNSDNPRSLSRIRR